MQSCGGYVTDLEQKLTEALKFIARHHGTCDNHRCAQHAKLALGLISQPAYGDWAYRDWKHIQDLMMMEKLWGLEGIKL